jgi:hypothetical protein
MGWKAALNLLEAASGIATRTHTLVQTARASNPAVEVVATPGGSHRPKQPVKVTKMTEVVQG